MSALIYIKGVRTRFRNSLEKEIQHCKEILQYDQDEIDKDEAIETAKACLKMLKEYCEKVENQCEKYVVALDENQDIDVEQIMDEDYSLCDEALAYSHNLDTYVEKLTSKIKEEQGGIKETTHMKQVRDLQDQMQFFMTEQNTQLKEFTKWQSEQQMGLFEKQMTEHHKVMVKLATPKDPTISVKLPKLELRSFNGDKLKWAEFWDSLECAVHKNGKLSEIEKFNYLQAKVVGEAKAAISGLSLCNENYRIAIALLQERFGKKQDIVDIHYQKMMNIAPPNNKTDSLRFFLDTTEKHLRSLEVLGENINQNMFISMIKTKLPKDVLLQLEMQKGTSTEWKVKELRERLQAYIVAREHSEQSPKGETSNKFEKRSAGQDNIPFGRNFSRQARKLETKQTLFKHPVSAEKLVSGD